MNRVGNETIREFQGGVCGRLIGKRREFRGGWLKGGGGETQGGTHVRENISRKTEFSSKGEGEIVTPYKMFFDEKPCGMPERGGSPKKVGQRGRNSRGTGGGGKKTAENFGTVRGGEMD